MRDRRRLDCLLRVVQIIIAGVTRPQYSAARERRGGWGSWGPLSPLASGRSTSKGVGFVQDPGPIYGRAVPPPDPGPTGQLQAALAEKGPDAPLLTYPPSYGPEKAGGVQNCRFRLKEIPGGVPSGFPARAVPPVRRPAARRPRQTRAGTFNPRPVTRTSLTLPGPDCFISKLQPGAPPIGSDDRRGH
eukprot:768626-Hanusia_phi.AAC.1